MNSRLPTKTTPDKPADQASVLSFTRAHADTAWSQALTLNIRLYCTLVPPGTYVTNPCPGKQRPAHLLAHVP